MTHASMDADARRVAGITDGLLRLSVGIESSDDLVADLRAALDAVSASTSIGVTISRASVRRPVER